MYIYIYKHGLYISENLPSSDMKADTNQILPNYTASHCNCPQAMHTSLLNSHGSIMTKTGAY